ncbi:hypothetical protein ACHAXH_006959, partial [Discostella pseudostelligera]
MTMSQGDGIVQSDDVDPPLLEPLLDTGFDESTRRQNQELSAGWLTLHGEPLDLHHLFPSGVFFTNSSTAIHNDPAVDIQEDSSPSSISSLEHQSCSTDQHRNTFGYMIKTMMYLPMKGQTMYRKTRRSVVNYFSSRNLTSNRGLTPVNNSSIPTANYHDDNSTNHSNCCTRRCNNFRTRNDATCKRKDRITQQSSISFSKSTPILLKLLLPPLLITNHVLFYHAQTKPMWNLAYNTNVTISATANSLKSKAAADALNVPHYYEYNNQESKVVETFTYMDAIRKLWEGVDLGDAQTLSKIAAALLVIFSGIWPHLKLVLLHVCWFVPFTHGFWLQQDNGEDDDKIDTRRGCCCTTDNGRRNATTGRVCSVCCSSVHMHQTHTYRSPFLRILSTLGKWSLADVLVVCILIAVLHLDWTVRPDEIREGIEKELPTLLDYAHSKFPDEVQDCTDLLHYTCGRHALVIHYPACLTCQALIKNAFYHPEWTASEGKDILEGIVLEGGGYAQLRVMGMVGTYYFCGAVIMSILLSLVIEFLDERDRVGVEEVLLDRRRELEPELELRDDSSPEMQPPSSNEELSSPSRSQQLNHSQASASAPHTGLDRINAHSTPHTFIIPPPTTNYPRLKQTLLILLSLSSLPFVCYAVALPTMQRLVYGGGPTLLHEVLGMIWEQEYSLISLVKTTGDAGGWDTFLMVTFGIFAVVGPVLRSSCLILHVMLGLPVAILGNSLEQQPRKRTTVRVALYRITCTARRALLLVVDALGAICCWEVLFIALIMIQLEMPAITDTIYQDDRCQEIDPNHGKTCIEVQFNTLDSLLTIVVAWIILIIACGLAIDLARDEDDQPHHIGPDETSYEFGQPIPRHRSNFSRNRGYEVGRIHETSNAVANKDNDDDEYFSPLGHHRDNGLE